VIGFFTGISQEFKLSQECVDQKSLRYQFGHQKGLKQAIALMTFACSVFARNLVVLLATCANVSRVVRLS
jgi:hypothetical protein